MARQFAACHYETADGLRLYYRDYYSTSGSHEQTILCLPGLTRNSRDFERLAEQLPGSSRVLCPDFRGRGKSQYDPSWRNYHPQRYADDVLELLQQQSIDQIRIVGTSLGALVATLLAVHDSKLIKALVINDVGPEIALAGLTRIAATAGTLEKAQTFDQAIENTREHYESQLPDWQDADWRWYAGTTYRETRAGDYDLNYDRNIGRAIRAGVSAFPGDPWLAFDALAEVPTLLVRGEQSDIMTPAIAAKMRKRKPDLREVVVPNRGHAPILDEPEAVHEVCSFLLTP